LAQSTYQFYADGSFYLEPAGLCGRAIEGTWNWIDDNRIEVEGTWSWYNGISAINDRRTMTVYLYLRSGVTEPVDLLWRTRDAFFRDVCFTTSRSFRSSRSPGVESAPAHPECPAQPRYRPGVPVLTDPGMPHRDSLAKYAAAF
jgi:hypothetical protein